MSDLRIALVAEGPTDCIIIEAALKAVLGQPFVLTQLQPEPTRPDMGGGWGGVFKWCQEFRLRGAASREEVSAYEPFITETLERNKKEHRKLAEREKAAAPKGGVIGKLGRWMGGLLGGNKASAATAAPAKGAPKAKTGAGKGA